MRAQQSLSVTEPLDYTSAHLHYTQSGALFVEKSAANLKSFPCLTIIRSDYFFTCQITRITCVWSLSRTWCVCVYTYYLYTRAYFIICSFCVCVCDGESVMKYTGNAFTNGTTGQTQRV